MIKDLQKAAIRSASIGGGIIAGEMVKNKVLPMVPGLSTTSDIVKNAVVAAVGVAGYAFKDKVGKGSLQEVVGDVCLGMAANGIAGVIKTVLPTGLKGTIGLGDATTVMQPLAKQAVQQRFLPAPNNRATAQPLLTQEVDFTL